MHLDFGQMVVQIVGFLILLWFLKRYAWGPILDILEKRRAKIKADMEGLEQEKAKLDALIADYQLQIRDIEVTARGKIQDAILEGQKMAEQIKEQARQAAQEEVEKAKNEINKEVAKARVSLRNEVVNLAIQTAEKIIRTRLDEEKQKELILQFIDEVPNLK